jgi:hypothetical protein
MSRFVAYAAPRTCANQAACVRQGVAVGAGHAEQRIGEIETGVRAFVRRALSPRPIRQLPEWGEPRDDGARKDDDE